jgi:hypothetical protein
VPPIGLATESFPPKGAPADGASLCVERHIQISTASIKRLYLLILFCYVLNFALADPGQSLFFSVRSCARLALQVEQFSYALNALELCALPT